MARQTTAVELHYRKLQTCKRLMDNLSSIRCIVERLPEGEFKTMLITILDDHKPKARPFQDRLPLG